MIYRELLLHICCSKCLSYFTICDPKISKVKCINLDCDHTIDLNSDRKCRNVDCSSTMVLKNSFWVCETCGDIYPDEMFKGE